MKEKTSAGISGLHFGHLKACASSALLSDFEATLAHIPYSTGYSPQGWKQSVNVMLEKGKGVLTKNLRTICLLEADFNFNNKVLAKQIMHCAERNHNLPQEQYGSRKGKKAILHAVNKRLLYDIIHLQRRTAILCSNDAKSCYDRIIHSVASMALQRLGLPPQPSKCMLTTIQDLEHHIRTAYGTSSSSMTNWSTIPFQGICQGNGAGPVVWVAVSTPLIEMMRGAGHGITFQAPLSSEQESLVGFTFVDDTDILSGNLTDVALTIQDIYASVQHAIDTWEGGLKATGGAIRPDKSFVYPISFEWDDHGKYKFRDPDPVGHPLTVKNELEVRETLEQVPSHVGRETLGVHLAPDGNQNDQLTVLLRKASEWADKIRTGHLPAQEA